MEKTVQTPFGAVRGTKDGAFLGIPYGVAKRFCPAEPLRWEGIRDCGRFAPVCPQPGWLGRKPEGTSFSWTGAEGPLTLNLWLPETLPPEGAPVAVYVHGGGFQVGSGSEPGARAEAFGGGDGVIWISVSYRLGALGGLYLGDLAGEEYTLSGSNSALDVLLALKWIHASVGAFGGDPERITVIGVSAGAKILAALMTLPESQGLFAQAWLESGATQCLRSRTAAGQVARGFLDLLPGVSLQDLATMPLEPLLEAQARLCDRFYSTCFFGPVLDDGMFSSRWQEDWKEGKGWRGRVGLGSARREMAFALPEETFFEEVHAFARGSFGEEGGRRAEEAVRRLSQGTEDTREVWIRVLSDFMYRSHTDRLARRLAESGSTVWLYSMEAWPACHGMGMSHILSRGPESAVEHPALARQMNGSMRSFLLRGDPGGPDLPAWPEFHPDEGAKLFFDTEPSLRFPKDDVLEEVSEYSYNIGL